MRTPWGDLPAGSPHSMAEQHDLLRSRISRRGLLKGAALLSASPVLLKTTPVNKVAPVGPRWIGFGDDPQTAMTISSSTTGAFRTGTVEYGTDLGFGASMPLNVQAVHGVSTRYGSARLTGLSPGSTYTYRVRIDGRAGPAATFQTAPSGSEPFTFTAFGDEGVTGTAKAVVSQVAAHKPQLHLLAGDLCYAEAGGHGLTTDKLNLAIWDKWLRLIEPVSAQVPWMTTVGNHEMEPGFGLQGYDGYLARFALPATGAPGCPSTYHFRYGSIAFVQLDSNDVSYEIPHNLNYSAGAQDSWLESVLADYRAPGSGIDMIVVTMHHCAYSTSAAHGSEAGVRDHWTKLFDQYAVDLVISGHNHSYERTHPIRDGVVTQQAPQGAVINSTLGTTYLTVGGGGAGLNNGFLQGSNLISTPDTSKIGAHVTASADWSATAATSYCYAVCTFTPGAADAPPTLAVTAYDKDGQQIDIVHLEGAVSSTSPTGAGSGSSSSSGGGDTGLYAGVGAGAAVLAAAGGTAYAVRRRPGELR